MFQWCISLKKYIFCPCTSFCYDNDVFSCTSLCYDVFPSHRCAMICSLPMHIVILWCVPMHIVQSPLSQFFFKFWRKKISPPGLRQGGGALHQLPYHQHGREHRLADRRLLQDGQPDTGLHLVPGWVHSINIFQKFHWFTGFLLTVREINIIGFKMKT